jgi:hypothetical protein
VVLEEGDVFTQSMKYQSNIVQTIDRPTEIDNSDIEGEHPGLLKPNLMVRVSNSRFHSSTEISL